MTSPGQAAAGLSQLAGSWTLDPANTVVEIHTKAMWVLNVNGSARAAQGEAHVGTDGQFSGRLVIDASSLDTKNKKRDAHLRTGDFLEVEKHPTITFEATGGRQSAPGRFEVDGTLTVRGQSRPLTLPVEVAVNGDSATAATEVDIDRGAWGLTWAKMGAGLKNQVVVRAHFTRT